MGYERKPFFYKRYIDDGFGICDGDLKLLQDFQEYANNVHENIKNSVTMEQESGGILRCIGETGQRTHLYGLKRKTDG